MAGVERYNGRRTQSLPPTEMLRIMSSKTGSAVLPTRAVCVCVGGRYRGAIRKERLGPTPLGYCLPALKNREWVAGPWVLVWALGAQRPECPIAA